MVRSSSIAVCCAALLAMPGLGAAQSFEEMVQGELDAQRVGSSLSGRNFGTGTPHKHRASFERAVPEAHFETPPDTGADWLDPTIVIAGARISPDIKRKGLKVRIPMGSTDRQGDAAAEDAPDTD